MSDRDYEAEARSEGWVPLDEWKGDPEKHKSAEQFVEDGEKITGILKSKVERYAAKTEDLEKRVEELLETNKQFGEFTKKAQERERKEKENLIKELQQVRAQAITDGDGDKAVKAEEDILALRESQQQKPRSDGIDPLGQDWLKSNDWYEKDDTLSAYADGIAERIINEGYRGKAYYDELTRRTKTAFPQKFENGNRKKPASVEEGHESDTGSKDRTFADLPKEARDMFKKFERDIPGFTKDMYLAQYEWE